MKRLQLQQIPNLGALLKSYFFAGLLVVIPLGVIAWILGIALRTVWQLHGLLPDNLQLDASQDPFLANFLNISFTMAATLILALGVSLVGWISRQYLGRKALDFMAHEIIQRIPVIRSVYSALDQLLRTLASGGGQQFSRVVYVEYPRKEVWALAFVTGPARGPSAPPHHLNVYVPTTPNPTSGFHLIVPEADVRETHMAVEEAFKTILSLGIAQPDLPPDTGPMP